MEAPARRALAQSFATIAWRSDLRCDTGPVNLVEVPINVVSPLTKRMDAYWRMERTCALIFPPIAFAAFRPEGWLPTAILALALAACCTTLWIGAQYWRAVWEALRHDRSRMPRALQLADRWQRRCLLLTIASAVASFLGIVGGGWSGASIAAFGLSVLAVLEYVNYYHVQLQHFDHGPTWRRFVHNRRFPRAHLARALAAYRARDGR